MEPHLESGRVTPSQWILDLPWLLRAPITFIYVDMLRHDDDSVSKLRKLVISVCIFIFGGPLSNEIYNWVTLSATEPASPVAFFSLLLMPLTWDVCYLLARLTKTNLDTIVTLFMGGTWVSLFLAEISYCDWPIQESMLLLAIVAQLLRAPKLPAWLILCTAGHVIATYNAATFTRGPPERTLAAIPGAEMRGFATRVLFSNLSLMTSFIVLSGLQLQLVESDNLTHQATMSSALALEVAQLLGNYDTDAARDALHSASEEQQADPRLLEAMAVLVDNLDKYRPHIPNWMLPRNLSTDGIEKDDDEDGTSSHRDAADRRSSQATRSTGSRRSTQSQITGAVGGDVQWLRGGQPFESFVSIAHFAYSAAHEPSSLLPAGVSVPFDVHQLNKWVDTVHNLASQTTAAVHNFVGDVIVITWNAANRATQSETKATACAARLNKFVYDHGLLRVHGSIVSGKARVQLAGGQGRQHVLCVGAPWFEEIQRLVFNTSRAKGCIAMDHKTRTGAEHTVGCAAAAALVSLTDVTRRIAVYEVRHEIARDDNDEWMYVLKGLNTPPLSARQAAMVAGADATATVGKASDRRMLQALDSWARGVETDDMEQLLSTLGQQ